MPRYRTAYPPEFRRQMVDLVRSGRTPEELAREFEPTAQSISTWVKHGGSASAPRGSSNCGGTTQRRRSSPGRNCCGDEPHSRRYAARSYAVDPQRLVIAISVSVRANASR